VPEPAARDPFEALGDPTRREILSLLGRGDCSVQEIAAALPISRPAVSRHRRIYRLREEGLDAVQAYLQRVWGEAAARFRLVAENTTERP
jgi:DNA-binding transcriptional ArsR family regulator